MSALTDLFTAMANKIRSKTGTATTYTPSEMASDGIDDVYDAGVASATTSITPSNSSPVSMTANTGYKPTANGYAIESYTQVSVYGSTVETVNEGIFKIEKGENLVTPKITGKTIQAITPSNNSPVDLYSANVLYSMSSAGKAVASVTSKTPSDSNPPFVAANSIIQPSAAGYLRSHSDLYETSLWTNSNPTSAFSLQSVSLSSNISDYKYIKVAYRLSASDSTNGIVIIPKDSLTSANEVRIGLSGLISGAQFCRQVIYNSDTSILFSDSKKIGASGTTNSNLIPTEICGLN